MAALPARIKKARLRKEGKAQTDDRRTPAGHELLEHTGELRLRDRAALLVDWLNELVFLAESRCAVPVEFEIQQAGEQRLRARVLLAPVPQPPSLVKAATHHGLRLAVRRGPLRREIPRRARPEIRVPVRVYADDELWQEIVKDRSLEQLLNVATLPA